MTTIDRAEIERQLAANLKGARKAKGLSQEELAAAMGIAGWPNLYQTSIWNIEHGKRRMTATEAIAFHRIIGMELP